MRCVGTVMCLSFKTLNKDGHFMRDRFKTLASMYYLHVER